MTEELSFIMMLALSAILIVFSISAKRQKEYREEEFLRDHLKWEREREKKSKSVPVPQQKGASKKTQSAEVIDSLNWMLSNSIITPQQYNEIMVKCLPFLE